MKITPKFQAGGQFDAFFTSYIPQQTQHSKYTQSSRQESPRSSQYTTDSEKGKLTEQDLFEMLKGIDGLPNEISSIVSNLMNTFRLSNLTGIDSGDLATTYLQNLYQIKIAAQNKKKYDEVVSIAEKNGSLAEPAISLDGRIVIQNSDGQIDTISLDTYMNNKDEYQPLTVSNLARMRAYTPQLINNQPVLDIISNSMGYEAFLALVDKAKQSLGSIEITRNGLFTAEGQASKGLALLDTLKQDDKVQALGSVTASGLYDYKIIDKSQKAQLDALTNYIVSVFPDRAKVWASIKTGNSNKNKALKDLVESYLFSGSNYSHSFDIQYKGEMDKVRGNSSSSKGSQEDPKKGFWSQVQSGHGGEDFRFNILSKQGSMSIDAKYYGTTPGLDSNKSLGDYINSSGVGYLSKNNKNITFGDRKISIDSFNDVMVNSGGGAAVVTLPIKVDGTVDLDVSERWSNIIKELENSGLQPNTPEYISKQKQLLSQSQLGNLIDSSGKLNRSRFGQFLVLEGYTSEIAKTVQDGKSVSFKDVQSDYIIPAGDDNELYNMVQRGLSSKDRGEYKFNRNWDWSFGYDELYRGNIYIPLNTNPISGYNADKNDIKESTSYLYEKAQQQYSTNSNDL